jgi:lipoprotein NlpI
MELSRAGLFALAALLLTAVLPGPARADVVQDCMAKRGDETIRACTEAIENPAGDLAWAFNNRGNAYRAKGDFDRALADYNQAISLDPRYEFAYNGRGNVYSYKGDLDRALADYNQAITLDPKDALAYNGRGNVYRAKGDSGRAIADYNRAITLNPKFAFAYSGRGLTNLYTGSLPKALADFNRCSEVDPEYAYCALWLEIVNTRSNLFSQLPQAIAHLDMSNWPSPLIRLFLGQTTPEAVLAAADDPDPETKIGQVCEANFFSGELALSKGSIDGAKRLFRLAADGCPRGFTESDAANFELKALGAGAKADDCFCYCEMKAGGGCGVKVPACETKQEMSFCNTRIGPVRCDYTCTGVNYKLPKGCELGIPCSKK